MLNPLKWVLWQTINQDQGLHSLLRHNRSPENEIEYFFVCYNLSPFSIYNGPPDLTAPILMVNVIEPRHEISNNVVCATSKASDQPAHKRSLIRAFAGRLNI